MKRFLSDHRSVVSVIAILLILACFSQGSIYRSYIKKDHRDTCGKARLVLIEEYAQRTGRAGSIDGLSDNVEPFSDEDLVLLNEIISDRFHISPDSDLHISGLCPDGGMYTIEPAAYGLIKISCSCEDHEALERNQGSYWEYVK